MGGELKKNYSYLYVFDYDWKYIYDDCIDYELIIQNQYDDSDSMNESKRNWLSKYHASDDIRDYSSYSAIILPIITTFNSFWFIGSFLW